MINMELPEFYKFKNIWDKLISLKNTKEKIFNENVDVWGFYGCFPNMDWNGGRVDLSDYTPNDNDIIETFNHYKDYEIILTLTNLELTEKDLEDKYCNRVCEIAQDYPNISAMVANNLLEEYMMKKYPKIKLNTSVILNLLSLKNKSYNYNVLNPMYNHNFDYLKQIEDKDKVVLLINSNCIINCPLAGKHYRYISKCQLTKTIPTWECKENCSDGDLSLDELRELEKIGINKFKLADREIDTLNDTLYSVCRYFVKPEYQNEIIILLKKQDIIY